jgi:hypothetical protein
MSKKRKCTTFREWAGVPFLVAVRQTEKVIEPSPPVSRQAPVDVLVCCVVHAVAEVPLPNEPGRVVRFAIFERSGDGDFGRIHATRARWVKHAKVSPGGSGGERRRRDE